MAKLANPAGTKPEDMMFRLSPSQLSNFKDDPRLFWTHHRAGLRLPEGIKSSIPNDIDECMKARYDLHRARGTLPAELAAFQKRGIKLCPDFLLLQRVRDWRKAPMWTDTETGCTMSGALDDIVVFPDGKMAPLDIKTTKKRDNFLAYATRYAGIAQSWYGILLEQVAPVGVHTHAFLPYFYPKEDPTAEHAMLWGSELVEMPLDKPAAIKMFRAAIACLRGPLPPKTETKDRDFDGWAREYARVVNPVVRDAHARDRDNAFQASQQ